MTTPKLKHLLSILCSHLSEKRVPHAIIGAMALSLYGMPRFTADIDLLSDEMHRKVILELMKNLDYECFQDAGNFAQFDSAFGVYGKVDFMFVNTDDGRAMLERSVDMKDEVLGKVPVVQPTDYAVLKLMAIANNNEQKVRDTADLEILFRSVAAGFLDPSFQPINMDQLKKFASRFHVSDHLTSLIPLLVSKKTEWNPGEPMDKPLSKKTRTADRTLIFEMIEESMALSVRKGPHSLTPGCNCIACINKRKRILDGPARPWRYRL